MLRKLGKLLNEAAERRSIQIAVALAVFMTLGGVDFAVGQLVMALLSPIPHGVVDGVIVGGVAGAMTWLLLEAARERRARIRSQIEESARLNHEIRNALEVISQAGYLLNDLDYGPAVSESVERIKNSLRSD